MISVRNRPALSFVHQAHGAYLVGSVICRSSRLLRFFPGRNLCRCTLTHLCYSYSFLDDVATETLRNADLVHAGLKPQTIASYKKGRDMWVEFRSSRNHTSIKGIYMLGQSRDTVLKTIFRFMRWLTEERNVRPHVASDYLTGVRHGFIAYLGDYEAFDSQPVRLARAGLRKKVTREEMEASARPEIQPLLTEQLDWLRASMWVGPGATFETRMTYMAIVTSHNLTLRICETCRDGPYFYKNGDPRNSDHRFYFADLVLQDGDGEIYNSLTYRDADPRPNLVAFKLRHLTSKTSGRESIDGRTYLIRREGSPREIEFFDDFVSWVIRSRVTKLEAPIFSRVKLGVTLELTGKMYRNALKVMAAHFGIDPRLYSGTSTRKGGSTGMHVAGRPDEEIADEVGHASFKTTLDHYIKDPGNRGHALRDADSEHAITVTQLKQNLSLSVSAASISANSSGAKKAKLN